LPNGTVKRYGVLWYARSYSSSITYNPAAMREVLQHESAHAILWLLGESAWAEYGRGHRLQ
jgi:hypothetical protein